MYTHAYGGARELIPANQRRRPKRKSPRSLHFEGQILPYIAHENKAVSYENYGLYAFDLGCRSFIGMSVASPVHWSVLAVCSCLAVMRILGEC